MSQRKLKIEKQKGMQKGRQRIKEDLQNGNKLGNTQK